MYVRQLETFKHDIAERDTGFRRMVDKLLCPRGQALLLTGPNKGNVVKMIRKVINCCLVSEKRAERFLRVVQETHPVLYAELTTCGPRGKFGE